MAESEGAAASVESKQTSEKMSLKAVVIGGTGAIGRCLLGELLSSKVVTIFMHLKYRDKKYSNSKIDFQYLCIYAMTFFKCQVLQLIAVMEINCSVRCL